MSIEEHGIADSTKPRTFSCTAGPRQSKGVKAAASVFSRTFNEHVELSGVKGEPEDPYNRTVFWSPFGGPGNPTALRLWSEIGERFGWSITRENYRDVAAALLAALPEARAARPVVDKRREPAEERARLEAAAARKAEQDRENEARELASTAIMAKRPAGAAALIVAELDVDTSDSMSDYFAHTTSRRVAIGWRTGKREDFRQLRRAAGAWPETAHLGPDAPADVEHRDNYSMGGGNFLKAGYAHDSGWRVVSESIGKDGTLPSWGAVLEDGLPAGTLPDPSRTCSSDGFLASRTANGDASAPSGSFRIQAGTNKRGPFVLVVLADRVERPEFERLRASAKVAGGWYSRAFGGQSGGFGFSDEAAARAWAEREFPVNVGTSAQVPTVSHVEPDAPTDSADGLEPGTLRADGKGWMPRIGDPCGASKHGFNGLASSPSHDGALCRHPFTLLSGDVVGCAVHGIRSVAPPADPPNGLEPGTRIETPAWSPAQVVREADSQGRCCSNPECCNQEDKEDDS